VAAIRSIGKTEQKPKPSKAEQIFGHQNTTANKAKTPQNNARSQGGLAKSINSYALPLKY
jgi:hypothetical protein